jgi:hypothetical protein
MMSLSCWQIFIIIALPHLRFHVSLLGVIAYPPNKRLFIMNRETAMDFSDIDLDDLKISEIETMEVSTSLGVPEGGASTATWSCGGGGASCSCSFDVDRRL